MCDFRNIKKIKLIETNEIVNVSNNTKSINYSDYISNNILNIGFYHVCASGSFHIYFTGTKVLYENNDILHYGNGFEVIDFEPLNLNAISEIKIFNMKEIEYGNSSN